MDATTPPAAPPAPARSSARRRSPPCGAGCAGVLPGQPPIGARQPAAAPRRGLRRSAAQDRAEHGDAEEDDQCPDADQGCRPLTSRPSRLRRREDAQRASSTAPTSARRRSDAAGMAMSSRIAATGGICGGPPGRGTRPTTVVTDRRRGTTRGRCAVETPARSRKFSRGGERPALRPIASRRRSPSPSVAPMQADDECLDDDRAVAPGGGWRPARAAARARGCAGPPASRTC